MTKYHIGLQIGKKSFITAKSYPSPSKALSAINSNRGQKFIKNNKVKGVVLVTR